MTPIKPTPKVKALIAKVAKAKKEAEKKKKRG